MIGLLGFIGWKVTVISSNFIALMLILNMAMNIHVTVRFLQLRKEFPELSKSDVVIESSKNDASNSLHCSYNYLCLFIFSFSGIKPIIDFGWMMTLGLIVSLFVTFSLLPTLLNLLSSEEEIEMQNTEKSFVTSKLASFTKNNKILIFGTTLLIIVTSIFGISKLEVEK